MGFHENAIFPTNISYGARGGPSFNTKIIELDSGSEERVSRWQSPRYRYNAKYGIRKPADVNAVLAFFVARLGAAYGFRFYDPFDHASTADGRLTAEGGAADPTALDQQIGTGTGSLKTFQLVKNYTSGSVTRTRRIEKPISGSVLIKVNGVAKTEGVDYTIDYTTGIVLFTTAPTNGHAVTAGYKFHVPVRFGEEVDQNALEAVFEDYGAASVPDIPLLEIVNEGTLDEEFSYRGSKAFPSLAANMQLSIANGLVQTLEPTVGSLKAFLPLADNLPTGGPYFYLPNVGSQTILLRTPADVAVLSITAGSIATVILGVDGSGTKVWYAWL